MLTSEMIKKAAYEAGADETLKREKEWKFTESKEKKQ